jgi:hypothetical protein
MIPNFGGFATGALPRRERPKDADLAEHPSVRAALSAPIPDVGSLAQYCTSIYNQGSVPSCVAHSEAGMMSGFEQLDENQKIVFDAPQIYKDCGGTGSNGIFTDVALQYAIDRGLPEIGSTERRKLESVAYTKDLAVICATLAAKRFVVFAWLLPTDFMQGDCGLGQPTSGYHQTVAVGYDKIHGRLEFLNSWGTSYGRKGFGSVSFTYLQSPAQQGFFYAYAATDILETPVPIPVPPPVPIPIPTPVPTPIPPPDKLIRITLRPTLVKRSILMGGGASLVVEVTKYGTATGIANVPVNLKVNGKDLGTKTSKTSFVNWVISKADFHGTAILTVDDPKYYKTLRMITLG